MRIITIALALCISVSCFAQQPKGDIRIMNTVFTAANGGKDTFYYLDKTKPYFEIGVSSGTKKDGTKEYLATKEISASTASAKNYRTENIFIVDENGKILKFKSPEDFLNFMDGKGYSMASQTAHKYGFNYTFKRK